MGEGSETDKLIMEYQYFLNLISKNLPEELL